MAVWLPDGKRVAVCLTFDFDAMSMFFARGNVTPQAISRGEFDARVAVPRLLKILRARDIPSTWFVPGHTAETWPEVTRTIAAAGHEIAHHGYCHECPLELTPEQEEAVLLQGIKALQDTVGERPVGYRAPRWDPSPSTVDLLVKHGFEYASNGMAVDHEPYFARSGDVVNTTGPVRLGDETSLVEVPSYWYLSDVVQLENVLDYGNRISTSPTEVEWMWREEFDYLHASGAGVITYAFHPGGVGRGYRAAMLTRLVEHLASHDDVWFATCREVARRFKASQVTLKGEQ